MSESDDAIISCGNVRASGLGISEIDSGRRVRHVPREGIDSIVLRHGCAAHNPVLELIVGLALFCLGVWGSSVLLIHIASARLALMFPFLAIVGAVMLLDVVRRRYFLEIVSGKQRTRIAFSNADATQIREFCSEIERRWNYAMRRDV